MFKRTREIISSNIKSELSVTGMVEDAKKIGEKNLSSKKGPAVSEETDVSEYKYRYKKLSQHLYMLLFFTALPLVVAVVKSDITSWIICVLTSLLIGMFYFKNAFIAFRGRYVFENWSERNNPLELSVGDFIDGIKINPMEIFPTKLKDSNHEKYN